MAAGTTKGQRTCIGCGSQGRKGGLLPHRARCGRHGVVRRDRPGAGAGSVRVFLGVLQPPRAEARKLDRALRCRLDGQDYERIAGEMTASGVRCTKED